MIAAIYSRKSNEQASIEEERSVQRQIDHAQEYAGKKGWIVQDEFIYADDGVSGAEFIKRPGFVRLMTALKPKPPFQVLIMSEESRLGREQIETSYALKQILDAGVRVFFYLEDRERVLESAPDKIMLTISNFAAEIEREKCRQRTHDALAKKAKLGHVTGGKVYGYNNVEVLSQDLGPEGNPQRLYVVHEINEQEAVVVRYIYDRYTQGWGVTRIAKSLNTDGVPAPRKAKGGWAPSAIWEILHRPRYRGEIVWEYVPNRVQGWDY